MKSLIMLNKSLFSTLLGMSAAATLPRQVHAANTPGLLHFPITVSQGAPIVKNMTKRQSDVATSAQQIGYFYTIDLVLGTPGQVVTVNFDTGSAELWVNPLCRSASDPGFCESFGRFNDSSTFEELGMRGHVRYGTGYVSFEYGTDYISLGSSRISQQTFGVAYDSQFSSVGIMGAGPDLSGWDSPYPLIIDSLVQQGFINSRAFSLDLRALSSDRGSVILGGIDTRKYSGHLEKRPIIPAESSPDGYTRYWIYLDGISINQGDGTDVSIFHAPGQQPVLLDSGYTLSALPEHLFEAMVAAVPSAKPIAGSHLYAVDCSIAELPGTVDFWFGETAIRVPYGDFIWRQPDPDFCVLGVYRDDEFPVLGDTFLRAAYVVYDWDNRNILLANNEDCGTNLVPIGSGPDAVPSLVGECSVSTPTTSPPVDAARVQPSTQTPPAAGSAVSSQETFETRRSVPMGYPELSASATALSTSPCSHPSTLSEYYSLSVMES
ncbi:aspartic peptidase domain-containing protein [Stachybotrys elegans]|uniref:Aspartic peptidase domain-containing protein n=1 Tax=Stachybotrys elegans TaxID=80388 RepID=A0A8K0SUN9_9HYPO|nr:aspartic peptidase domain-containing protein [Stachybotrys elegans]